MAPPINMDLSGIEFRTISPVATTEHSPIVTPGSTFASRHIQAPSLITTGLWAYSRDALRKSCPPEQIMERWEIHTFDSIVIFSWLISHTSSPIQESFPIMRFHGKWILTPRRITTPRPIELPNSLSKGGRSREGKSGDLNTMCCTGNQIPAQIFHRSVKFESPEKTFNTLFTLEVYF